MKVSRIPLLRRLQTLLADLQLKGSELQGEYRLTCR